MRRRPKEIVRVDDSDVEQQISEQEPDEDEVLDDEDADNACAWVNGAIGKGCTLEGIRKFIHKLEGQMNIDESRGGGTKPTNTDANGIYSPFSAVVRATQHG